MFYTETSNVTVAYINNAEKVNLTLDTDYQLQTSEINKHY